MEASADPSLLTGILEHSRATIAEPIETPSVPEPPMAYGGYVSPSGVYRTKQGRTLRIRIAEDGALSVQILADDGWIPASVRMAGLRLSPTTRKLTATEIAALPA